jgi:uncharacterized protein
VAPPRDDAAALIIRIAQILQGGYALDIAVSPSSLQLPQCDDAMLSGDVRIEGRLTMMAEQVYFTGVIRGAVTLPCSRCLQPAQSDFTAETRGVFLPSSSNIPSSALEGKAGPTDEIDLYIHDGTLLDLKPLVREQVVLAIPIQAFCRSDCAGLCHACGCNLNNETCACQMDNLDPRFAVLNQLRQPKSS